MPSKVATLLQEQDLTCANVLLDVIPFLAFLLEREEDVEEAFLCDDTVKQVSKLENEGGHFCGYRNIQMLASALEALPNIPIRQAEWTIPKLQRSIEKAWDEGHHACGRAHVGSIIGTRKHIGTPEVRLLKYVLYSCLIMLTSPTGGRVILVPRQAWRVQCLHW